jgi:4-diphosphocytidyl-2-C-methyl-D-erythritol kinase
VPAIRILAPAKVNLCLHVTGRRADGYHLLDGLVAFAPMADVLVLTDAPAPGLTVDGPQAAGVPVDATNLVLRAAALVAPQRPVAVRLTKHLPAAAGIGGGSSDAAAVARALGATDPGPLRALGADVPMCLTPRPWRSRGTGEDLTHVPLPPLPAVLVNPRVAVPTAPVFAGLARRDNPPLPDALPALPDAATAIAWLATQRNDLEAPARAIAPAIGAVLTALAATPGCGLARMSGSGATCFGLFPTDTAAAAAARALRSAHPDWWITDGPLGDQTSAAAPHPA